MLRIIKQKFRGENVILVSSEKDSALSKVAKLSISSWVEELNSWVIPYSQEAYGKLVDLGEVIQVVEAQSDRAFQEGKRMDDKKRDRVEVHVSGKLIYLKLMFSEADIAFLRGFKYSRWSKVHNRWEVPNYKSNLHVIQQYFKDRIYVMKMHHHEGTLTKSAYLLFNDEYIWLSCERDNRIDEYSGNVVGSRWIVGEGVWRYPYSIPNLKYFEDILHGLHYHVVVKKGDEIALHSEKRKAWIPCPEAMVHKMEELRMSPRTIDIYSVMFSEFVTFFNNENIDDLDESRIHIFLRHLIHNRRVSASFQNQSINAIKFYYERVLLQPRHFYSIDRPYTTKSLPTVLNMDEIKRMITGVTNVKHKTIILLAYSSGLRISELLNLRPENIDKERMQIHVVDSKGNKDRYTILSERMLQQFRIYYQEYSPANYVFEGAKGHKYSASSIQKIVRSAAIKAGIKKKVTTHTLRHTFATHCLENGIDLRYIQSMLGHDSSKTTEIYTKVSSPKIQQLKSPLDQLYDE